MKIADREQLVAELVKSALEHDQVEQAKFLDEACGDDAELRAEVESLLKFKESAHEFIESPAYEKVAGIMAHQSGELTPGEILGDYKILSLLGEGGMGEVYLAEDTKLQRKVAIKLLKLGLGTTNLVRHFYEEERILAGLTHPNIAQLYSGGLTPNGLPYFVMEYVDGPRLDDYCRKKYRLSGSDLSIRERLELFRKICSAVSYAHQHLVIHRDIKPANIRVTANGEPKLLDFGIAKLVDPAASGMPEATMTFAAVMTPEYASPEQVRGQIITTVSDVYSLGVVLYELLTEQKPYKFDDRTPTSVARAITEREPTRPSMAVNRAQSSGIRSRKALRGDLDNIVLKALRKEPARRYASVGQFSEDIRRHLEGLPVIARKDSAGYRAGKFVQRHKIGVAAAAIVALALVGGMAATTWEARVARVERDRARVEAIKAGRINEFMQGMLKAADPSMKGSDAKVVDVLNAAASDVDQELANEPEVLAQAHQVIGGSYMTLFLLDAAEPHVRAALDLNRKIYGEESSATAKSLTTLAYYLYAKGDLANAEKLSRRSLEVQRKLGPQAEADLANTLWVLGDLLRFETNYKAAEPFLQESLVIYRKLKGNDHEFVAAALHSLALMHDAEGDLDGAISLYRQTIDILHKLPERRRLTFGDPLSAFTYLGFDLTWKGKYDEAELPLNEAVDYYTRIAGDKYPLVGRPLRALAYLHQTTGELPKARQEIERAIEVERAWPPGSADSSFSLYVLGLVLMREGNLSESEARLREAWDLRSQALRKGNIARMTEGALGECLTMQKRYVEAEPLVVQSYQSLKANVGPNHPLAIEALKRVTNLYEAWGKPDEAARVR